MSRNSNDVVIVGYARTPFDRFGGVCRNCCRYGNRAYNLLVLFYVLGPANSPVTSSIAMIIPFFVIPFVSIFTKLPDKDLVDKAFKGV